MGKLLTKYLAAVEGREAEKGLYLTLNEVDEKDKDFIDDCQKIALDIATHSAQEQPTMVLSDPLPQPVVGAALYCEGKLYCASRSGEKIGDHAEYTVLETMTKGIDYKRSILFTTLEPCTKFSRKPWTESCAELIANKGVPEIYFGCLDANPNITGLGIRRLLEENNVIVHSFLPENAKRALNLNMKFFECFKNGVPWKTVRDIEQSFHSLLDHRAVGIYLGIAENEPSRDQWVSFYRDMALRGNVIDDKITGFRATPEFALAFFKDPSIAVPGFEAVIRNNMKGTTTGRGTNRQIKEIRIRGPLIEMLGDYSFPNPKRNVFGAIQNFIGDDKNNTEPSSFAENCHLGEEQSRELIINAFVHATYQKHGCITVELDEESLTIRNAVKSPDVVDGFLKSGKTFSLPWNPALMEFLARVGLVEKQGQSGRMRDEQNAWDLYEHKAIGDIDFVETKIRYVK